MPGNVVFRWLALDEARMGMDAIGRLWNVHHTLAADEKLFRWQYGTGPDADHLGFLVAEDDGEIVGCSGLILLPFHVHGRHLRGGCGSITIMAPQYRLAMTGYRMMAEADRDWDIIVNCGINARVARLYRIQKRHVFDAFPRVVAGGRKRALDTYLESAGYTASEKQKVRGAIGWIRPTTKPGGYTIRELDPGTLEEWEQAWRRDFAPRLVGVERSSAFMRWRYLEHPAFEYKGAMARDASGKICGLAVWREVPLPQGMQALRILDFLPLDPAAGKTLAASIAERIPDNCAYVEHSSTGQWASPLASIGLSSSAAPLISVYTNPPVKTHCSLIGSYMIQGANVGMDAAAFAASPDLYLSLADFDCDRPHNKLE